MGKPSSALELSQSNLPSPTDMERSAYHQPQKQSHVCWNWSVPSPFTWAAPAWSIFATHIAHGCIWHRYKHHTSIKNIIPLLAGISHGWTLHWPHAPFLHHWEFLSCSNLVNHFLTVLFPLCLEVLVLSTDVWIYAVKNMGVLRGEGTNK